jgi:hypothetical protein
MEAPSPRASAPFGNAGMIHTIIPIFNGWNIQRFSVMTELLFGR